MARSADLAEAAADPRSLPPWYFVGVGALVALALMLLRTHTLFLLIPGVGLIFGVLLGGRRGTYAVNEDAKSAITLQSPLPGTMAPMMMAIAISLTAAFVVAGSLVPTSVLPFWAVVVISCTVGAAVAALLRRSELLRIAGTRRLERQDP